MANSIIKNREENKGKKKMTCVQETNLMLEEMLKEPNIDGKIEELESSLEQAREAEKALVEEAIEKGKTLKPHEPKMTQEQEAKRNQRDAKKDEMTLVREEIIRYEKDQKAQEIMSQKRVKLMEEAMKPRKDIERRLSFYRAFKEHKDEILNLRDYQLVLQNKLDNLEAKKQEIDDRAESYDELNQRVQSLYNEMRELLERRHELENKLIEPNLSDDERQQISDEIKDITGQLTTSEEERSSLATKKKEMTVDVEGSEKLAAQITKTRIAITKTSLIWRTLLAGRNWDEIEVALSKARFTGSKETTDRIEDLGEVARGQRQEQGQARGQSQGQGIGQSQGQGQGRSEEQGQARSEGQGQARSEGQGHEGISEKRNETKLTLPAEYRSYKEEHRILGRIPFWGKHKEKQRQQEYDQMKAEYEQAKEKYDQRQEEKKKEKKDQSYLINRLSREDKPKQDTKQIDVFKSIAQNGIQGIRETVKVDQQTRINLMRVAAAHAQAEKFGGRYNEQEDREEEKAGIEPGDN